MTCQQRIQSSLQLLSVRVSLTCVCVLKMDDFPVENSEFIAVTLSLCLSHLYLCANSGRPASGELKADVILHFFDAGPAPEGETSRKGKTADGGRLAQTDGRVQERYAATPQTGHRVSTHIQRSPSQCCQPWKRYVRHKRWR